jgi:hypothetical protein
MECIMSSLPKSKEPRLSKPQNLKDIEKHGEQMGATKEAGRRLDIHKYGWELLLL